MCAQQCTLQEVRWQFDEDVYACNQCSCVFADFAEEKLRAHFVKFGHVEDIEWPFDRQRNVRRNFAFIVFETEDAADAASVDLKQTFGEREVSACMHAC